MASELVALALQGRGRARLLGAATAGKGTVQAEIDMPDKGVLKVTQAIYYGPSGQPLGDDGVLPNRPLAPPSRATVVQGASPQEDPWVRAALEDLAMRPSKGATAVGVGVGPAP